MSTLMILFAMAIIIALERVGGLRRAMAIKPSTCRQNSRSHTVRSSLDRRKFLTRAAVLAALLIVGRRASTTNQLDHHQYLYSRTAGRHRPQADHPTVRSEALMPKVFTARSDLGADRADARDSQ